MATLPRTVELPVSRSDDPSGLVTPAAPPRSRNLAFRTGLMHTRMNPISRLLVIPAKARIQSPSAQAVSPCSSQGQALDPAFAGVTDNVLLAHAPLSEQRRRNGHADAAFGASRLYGARRRPGAAPCG